MNPHQISLKIKGLKINIAPGENGVAGSFSFSGIAEMKRKLRSKNAVFLFCFSFKIANLIPVFILNHEQEKNNGNRF